MENDWRLTHLKFVIFYAPTVAVDAGNLWGAAFEDDAPEYRRAAGQSVAGGPRGPFRCDIVAAPGRAEMVFKPAPEEAPTSGPDYLADGRLALSLGLEAAGRWSDIPITRCAIALEAHRAMESQEAAVAETIKELRLPLPGDVTDFNLQLNRRRAFEGGPGFMNRLCTWAAGSVRTMLLVITGGSAEQTDVVNIPVRILRLDLNSLPSDEPLAELAYVWSDLAKETTAILSEGYARLVP